ncbi:MAG: efflux RND transporter periplasmic adaptor subunit [Burkholderiales bacterium]
MRTLISIAAALSLAACGHDRHDDAKTELTAVTLTHFTEATELYIEFDPLRAGEASVAVAHLTRLADFKPLKEGRVAVVLSGGGQPDERFEAQAPATPGIFKPELKARAAGTRKLTLLVEAGDLRDAHDLGEVTVYASKDAARAAQAKGGAPDSGIKFLKEQQWQTEFATAPAEEQPLRATIAATGFIRGSAEGSAQLVAPVSGQLVAGGSAFPHIGQTLGRGEVAFAILPRLAPETDAATLRLDADRARLKLAYETKERARLEQLYREEAVPERRVLAVRREEALARAELEAAERRLAPYAGGGAGSAVLVRAPVRGTLVEVNFAPGAYVNAGQLLAQIADPARLWLEAKVAEADAARLAQVQGAWVRAAGLAEPLALEVGGNARLVALGQALDRETRTVPLILEFRSPGTALRIGAAVQVDIWTGKRDKALAVPASALVDEGGQSVLFVQRGGESFERRSVGTGIRDGNQVEIREGLKAGERVVTRGAYLVRLAGASPKAAGEGHAH